MVNFSGLEEMVVKFERELVLLTQELSDLKEEIDRVKKDYHAEKKPTDNIGIREFMLERAEARFGQHFDKSEDIPEVIEEIYELTDREVKKESVILCFNTEHDNVISNIGNSVLGGFITRYLFTENYFIKYDEGVGKKAGLKNFSITKFADIQKVSLERNVTGMKLVCKMKNDEYGDSDIYDENHEIISIYAEEDQKMMLSFLRDILEYVNPNCS